MVATVVLSGCGEKPVAVVNGNRITEAEFIRRLKKPAGEQVLRTMIDRQLIEQEFEKLGLQVPPEEVAERLAELQAQFPTPEAVQQFLESQGMTLEEVQEELLFNAKLEMLVPKDVQVTEEGLKDFYKEYEERYQKPLRVTIREIVVSTKEEAENVLKEVEKPDADFAALATQYSLSVATRQYGGKRPETPIQQLYPQELRAAAGEVKVGGISEPIEADQQWYIIKVEERKAAEKADFEKVRPQVVREYKRGMAVPLDELLRRLREAASVSIVAPDLQELNELYQVPAELPPFGPEEQKPPEQPSAPAESEGGE